METMRKTLSHPAGGDDSVASMTLRQTLVVVGPLAATAAMLAREAGLDAADPIVVDGVERTTIVGERGLRLKLMERLRDVTHADLARTP